MVSSLSPPTISLLREQRKIRTQRRPMEKAMYLFEYRFFSCLQEPKNKSQLGLKVFIDFDKLDIVIEKYQRLGLIQIVDLSPNKFMLTVKGKQVLYLIRELNKLIDKYVTLEL